MGEEGDEGERGRWGLGEIEQEREVWERNSSRRLTRRGMETEGGV